jgi:hypothetical protein
MSRVVLTIAVLVASAEGLRPNQEVYPPLTRETLVGTWEGLIGIESHPVVFHVVIAPRDSDSLSVRDLSGLNERKTLSS